MIRQSVHMRANGRRAQPSVRRSKIAFTIPVPPSTNNLFFTSLNGRRCKTDGYKAWREEAAVLSTLRLTHEPPFKRPIVSIEVPPNYRRDLDNYLKPICDFLQMRGLIENDNRIEALSIRRVEGLQACYVTVEES